MIFSWSVRLVYNFVAKFLYTSSFLSFLFSSLFPSFLSFLPLQSRCKTKQYRIGEDITNLSYGIFLTFGILSSSFDPSSSFFCVYTLLFRYNILRTRTHYHIVLDLLLDGRSRSLLSYILFKVSYPLCPNRKLFTSPEGSSCPPPPSSSTDPTPLTLFRPGPLDLRIPNKLFARRL